MARLVGVLSKSGCFRLFQTICVVVSLFLHSLQLLGFVEDIFEIVDVLCCLLVC